MKKFLLLHFRTILFSLMLLCCTSQTFASHFRYGNVSWRRISETPTTITIGVTVNISWRANPSNATFQIENGTLSGGGTSFTIVPTNTTDPVGGWINSNGYTEITLNKSIGITTLRYRGSAKLSTSMNNPNGFWNVFTTINTSATGNAPISAMPAVINMPVGVPNALYNMSASDPDPGTVLTYRFATALEDNASLPPGLSIDANTGQLAFNTVGKIVGQLYNVLVVVTDNDGNSTLIDFLINIIQGSTAPEWDYSVTPADNTVYNIVVGEQLSFKLKATDSDVASTVKIGVSGLPNYIDPLLVFTPNLPAQGNLQSESVFTWTPSVAASGKSFVLNFLAQDNTGMGTNSSVLIKVNSEAAPVFVAPTPNENSIRQIMPGDVFSDVIKAQSTSGSLTSIVYATYPSGASLDKTVPTQNLDPSEVVVNWVSTAANFGPNVFEFQVAIAADPSIFTSRKYTVVVNTPSFFESTPLTTAFVGQKYSYTVNINDIDIVNGDQIELDGVTIPSWLTLVKQSEKIYLLEGTPSLGDVGLNAVSLHAEDIYHHDPSSDHVFQNFDINVKQSQTIVFDPLVDKICGDVPFSLTATASSGLQVIYTSSDPAVAKIDGTLVTILKAGTVIITATQTGNNTYESASQVVQSLKVNAPAAIIATVSQENAKCFGDKGSAEVTVIGGTSGLTFSWSPSGGTSATATGLVACATPYVCTITNACGGSAIVEVTITEPTAISATVSQENAKCFGDKGSATVVASGGTGILTYLWSPSGETSATATGLAASATPYVCTITDANGCFITKGFTITEPKVINSALTFDKGVLSVNETGATYQWFNCLNGALTLSTNQSFTPTVSGDYKVIVSLNSCSVTSDCFKVATLGTIDFDSKVRFVVYPNPSNGVVTIQSDFDGNFRLVNQMGQTVKTFSIKADVENKINVENFSDGIYLINGINEGKKTSQKIIIKK
jgi:hypothetical protein